MRELQPLEISDYFNKEDIGNSKIVIPGIYFLYNNKREIMYIGKTKDILDRLRKHFSGSTNTKMVCHYFKYFRFAMLNDAVDRDIYETFYINKLKSPLNIDKTFTYKSKIDEFSIRTPEPQKGTRDNELMEILSQIVCIA